MFLPELITRLSVALALTNLPHSWSHGPPPSPPGPLPEMVLVTGGQFQMGSGEADVDEKPVHAVTVTDFFIGKYEVTVGQYLQFVAETEAFFPEWLEPGSRYHVESGTDSYYKDKGYSKTASTLPIVGISWKDALAYCQWLSQKTNQKYRLPTEAEWEYAARGGPISRGYLFSGSNTLTDVAWCLDNAGSKPQPVGQKNANELGLFDLSGNVWEWCADWYEQGYFAKSPGHNPSGPAKGASRVIRGGGWNSKDALCRVANRLHHMPDFRFTYVGFRLARGME